MSDHAIEQSWSILKGENDGRPMFVRLNEGAHAVAGSAAYGIRVGVAIPLRNPRPDGLPDKAESEQLAAIEDALIANSSEHAILVAVITTSGMREFVFYTGAGDWIPGFHQRMMRSTSSHEVQCMAEHDPGWTVYHQLGGH
jgi:hypothetical protein